MKIVSINVRESNSMNKRVCVKRLSTRRKFTLLLYLLLSALLHFVGCLFIKDIYFYIFFKHGLLFTEDSALMVSTEQPD